MMGLQRWRTWHRNNIITTMVDGALKRSRYNDGECDGIMMTNSKVQRLQTRRLNDGERGATVIVDYARNVGTMVQS
jgi:hypothetical protein